ncbi:unnamed protein product [Urochloa humidicola]
MHWLHEEDADTKFFHLHANHCQHRNHISFLVVDGSTMVGEDEEEATFQYFDEILGSTQDRSCALDFTTLGLLHLDLACLGYPFIEAEIWEVIKDLPMDKVP